MKHITLVGTTLERPKNDPTEESTGLPLLKTWKLAYWFVIVTFAFWLSALILLTECSS